MSFPASYGLHSLNRLDKKNVDVKFFFLKNVLIKILFIDPSPTANTSSEEEFPQFLFLLLNSLSPPQTMRSQQKYVSLIMNISNLCCLH